MDNVADRDAGSHLQGSFEQDADGFWAFMDRPIDGDTEPRQEEPTRTEPLIVSYRGQAHTFRVGYTPTAGTLLAWMRRIDADIAND